jgi:hypothetical protein
MSKSLSRQFKEIAASAVVGQKRRKGESVATLLKSEPKRKDDDKDRDYELYSNQKRKGKEVLNQKEEKGVSEKDEDEQEDEEDVEEENEEEIEDEEEEENEEEDDEDEDEDDEGEQDEYDHNG